jgi:hypothetical protein
MTKRKKPREKLSSEDCIIYNFNFPPPLNFPLPRSLPPLTFQKMDSAKRSPSHMSSSYVPEKKVRRCDPVTRSPFGGETDSLSSLNHTNLFILNHFAFVATRVTTLHFFHMKATVSGSLSRPRPLEIHRQSPVQMSRRLSFSRSTATLARFRMRSTFSRCVLLWRPLPLDAACAQLPQAM